MEADLHNLYPSRADINRARSNFRFGMIEGEIRKLGECDFERDGSAKIAEPRPITRGNIARAIFYMHKEYGLPVDSRDIDHLEQWNRDDPPNCNEMRRNNVIEELQGTRNRFIDHPKWVERENRRKLEPPPPHPQAVAYATSAEEGGEGAGRAPR